FPSASYSSSRLEHAHDYSRQTRQHRIADDLHAARRNLIDRIVSLVPMRIAIQLDQINRVNAGFQKRFMILPPAPPWPIHENFSVPEGFPRLPNDVLQPFRTHGVATELQIFITNHIEQNQRAGATQLSTLAQL